MIAPQAACAPIGGEILLVDTPGVTADDTGVFTYERRQRPLYPLEPDAEY